MNKYPHLFQPIKIRNITYRNRIFSAPCAMTYSGHKHSPDLMQMLYFEEKARGGTAAVTIFEAIGDCTELGQVRGAVQAGYFRALDIL